MSGHIRLAGVLVLGATVLAAASCARISTPTVAAGGIPTERLTSRDIVPAEWGELVSVSSVAEYPDLAQLWFRATDGSVRYVVVSLRRQEILNAHVIRRAAEVAP
jgi:hypothetical protein